MIRLSRRTTDRAFDFLIGRKHSRKDRQVKVSFRELKAQIYWPSTDQKVRGSNPCGRTDKISIGRMKMFKELDAIGYDMYLKKYPFHLDLGIELKNFENSNKSNKSKDHLLRKKIVKDMNSSVDPTNLVPYPAELDDLIRLHYLCTSRKIVTILEFGVGKSTIVFNNALACNKQKYYEWVKNNLRRHNIFECHSVDNSRQWIRRQKKLYQLTNVQYHFSHCKMGLFNDRICTYYDKLPNISPDLIYLDAPDQFSVKQKVSGLSTRHPDRLPMAADILRLEHFLLPGTLIVVDGRAGNARFLKSNLQRKWTYNYIESYDQHFFELNEHPLGLHNKKQIKFLKSGSSYVDHIR